MALEEKMEQSEKLVEKHETNKQQVQVAQKFAEKMASYAAIAGSQLKISKQKLADAENALKAAREAAGEDGQVDLGPYEAAVAEATRIMSRAKKNYEEAGHKLNESREALERAQQEQEGSARELQSMAAELREISQKYGIELSKTSALEALRFSGLAAPLLERLGIGQGKVDEMRARIAASLGIGMSATGVSGGGAGGAGGSASGSGMNLPTRKLTDDERADVQATMGWTDKQMNKCTIDENGVIHYKTDNTAMEGQLSATGVPYVRRQVEINGRTVEGVFPSFTSYRGLEARLPANMYTSNNADQFKECNRQLQSALAANPEMRRAFTTRQLRMIDAGKTPSGFVWHHNEEQGRMQLVLTADHDRTQGGAAHTGGDALWGGMGER